MASLVYRLKGSAATGILRFPFRSPCFYGHAWMISSAMSSISNSSSVDSALSSPPPRLLAPWLMLPQPPFKAGDLEFECYKLTEDRVESLGVKIPNDNNADTVLVGSSHGWLAFFNESNNHLFLTNPLSGRHLKLPPIHTLPDPEINLRDGRGTVSKVILSCSPDDKEEECRAMMSFGPGDRLAFCLPGHSPSHWTPIGELFFGDDTLGEHKEENGPDYSYGRAYEDFVYCSRRKLFSCITQFIMNHPPSPTELEDWDLREPGSPRSRICKSNRLVKIYGENCSWLNENRKLLRRCLRIPYLVFAEQSDQLFVVMRFISVAPYKTLGFSVLRVEYQNGVVDKLRLIDDSEGGNLDGLALFVGINHSFAVSSSAELGLKPNSIYFTDALNARLIHSSDVRRPYHSNGRDIGIFDYVNKTLSPIPYNYSSHDDQILSTPTWFTPSE